MLKLGLAFVVLLGSATMALAQDDVAAGEALFKGRCLPCHAIGVDAPIKVGPPLNGVVGAPIGNVPGFSYSSALAGANVAGRVWTITDLRRFMFLPKKLFPGTKMAFAGQRDPADLANLVAYLQSFAADGTRIGPVP